MRTFIQAGARPDPLPEGLKVGQPRTGEGADDHPRVRLHPGDFLQHVDRRLSEVDDLGSGLGIQQPQRFARQVDVIPLKRHDLVEVTCVIRPLARGTPPFCAPNAVMAPHRDPSA